MAQVLEPAPHSSEKKVLVVIAIALWGLSWRSTTVQVFSDNIMVVSGLSSGSASDFNPESSLCLCDTARNSEQNPSMVQVLLK